MIDKLETYEDARGVILFASPKILNFDYKYLTMGTINPDCKRGGHYHNRIREMITILTGEITLILEDVKTRKIKKEVLSVGDVAEIPIGAIHTIVNDSNKVCSFVEFKSEEFDKNDKDTYS